MKIGIVIMLAELRDLKRALTWEEIKQSARQIEDLNFDSIWIYDHLLYRNEKNKTTGIWEGWSMLSALAASTQRVELGPLVVCNSFRNPALLAKMAHTVDEISGGRLILGIGAGWNQPEYDAFGFPFDHRVSRFEESLKIIQPLLRTGQVDFSGQYYTVHNCEITPRSPRPGGPPLLIGTSGPRMMHLTAQYADAWNTAYTSIPRSGESRLKDFLKACKDVGRDRSTIQVTFTVSLAYPDLLGWDKDKKRGYLTGSVYEVASVLKEYETMGTDHLMFHISPFKPEAIERLSKAVEIYQAAH